MFLRFSVKFLFSFKILNMYFCRRINSYIFINFYSIHILLLIYYIKVNICEVISMENYQQFLDSPNTFVLIAFILYLICAFVFFTVTVFIGLRHVSLIERIITTLVLTIILTLTLTGLTYCIVSK